MRTLLSVFFILSVLVPTVRSDEGMAGRMKDLGYSRVPTYEVMTNRRVQYVRGFVSDQQADFIIRTDGMVTAMRPAYGDWLRPATELYPERAKEPLPPGLRSLKVASYLRLGDVVLTDEMVAMMDDSVRLYPSFDHLGTLALFHALAVWMPASKEIYFRYEPMGNGMRQGFENDLTRLGYQRVPFSTNTNGSPLVPLSIEGHSLALVIESLLDFTIIESKKAKQMGLRRRDSTLMLKTPGEKRSKYVDISDVVEMKIGETTLRRPVAIAADAGGSNLNKGLESPVDGLLGMDVLIDLKAIVDWEGRGVWLAAPRAR